MPPGTQMVLKAALTPQGQHSNSNTAVDWSDVEGPNPKLKADRAASPSSTAWGGQIVHALTLPLSREKRNKMNANKFHNERISWLHHLGSTSLKSKWAGKHVEIKISKSGRFGDI